MSTFIDISVPLSSATPVWPTSTGFKLVPTMRISNGDIANVSKLECDVHVGTHVDAPFHFVDSGESIDELDLDALIGSATVVYFPESTLISADHLEGLNLDMDVERLLLRTRNSFLWAAGEEAFHEDYVALTADAAEWVVQRNIKTIGVDYLSVQRYRDSSRTHEVLLQAGVVILEGLNLADVDSGQYELICLPVKLVGSDGAPARAILRTI